MTAAPRSARDPQDGERPAPLNPCKSPPDDCYCDLVLKGGVVDGVVYPWAIMELARAFRFRNISGTSVGAVAAALTAAAEYSRRLGSNAGFNEVLLKLPEDLAAEIGGDTRLFTLFQPSPGGGQRLFTVFVALFGQASKVEAAWQAYGKPVLFACLASIAVLIGAFGVSLVQAVVDGAMVALLTLAVMLCRDLLGLAGNGFGLCSGKRLAEAPHGRPAFTDWLHEGIQAAAQRPLDQPLTFRHLWEAPGGAPSGGMVSPLAARGRSIDLRMISTSLSHGRPYGLPLGDDGSRLFFRIEELQPYFPDTVMAHLRRVAQPYQPLPGDPPIVLPAGAGELSESRQLPQGDLPVLVATRMSLSFPVLFKAVPLYAIDAIGAIDAGSVATMRRCWFADGGICSNFMIHQFDAILPKWPTFGIALEADRDRRVAPPEPGPAVVVTRLHGEGREEVWNRFDPTPDATPPQMSRLTGFLVSLLDATKDWNDNTTMRMSGTRDRIARIRLSNAGDARLGGLNLRLSGLQIMRMAREFGWPAGRLLVEKFSPTRDRVVPGVPLSGSWNEHRWVRFQSFVHGLRHRVAGFEAASERAGYCMPLSRQIDLARTAPPLAGAGEVALTPTQADALEATRQALVELEKSFAAAPVVQPYQPMPPPEMRLRMPL